MPEHAAFRHDPVRSVLPGPVEPVRWDREPAVCGYRRLTYDNKTLGRTIPVPVSASPAVLPGVGAVLAGDDGHVRLVDRSLAKTYWQRRLDSSIYASVVVDRSRRHVVVTATSGMVTCFDLRGRLVWSARIGREVRATPTVLPGADVLVVAAFGSRCVGLDLGTGATVFDRPLPRPWHAAYGGSAAHRDPYASPATTAEDTAVVCCAEHVLCLAADGTELWRTELGTGVKASPVAVHATGEILACGVDGCCMFLDAGTGDPRSTVALDAKVTASPGLSGPFAAVGLAGGQVVGIDVRTRAVAWTAAEGAPRSYTSFSVLPDGGLMATCDRGNALCLDPADGSFRWETSQVLGIPDHEPGMDVTPVAGTDGSMYCASYSGFVYHFRFPPTAEEDPR